MIIVNINRYDEVSKDSDLLTYEIKIPADQTGTFTFFSCKEK